MEGQIIELLTKILCDIYPPTPTEAAYLFAQTTDNRESVVQAGADLLHQGKTGLIMIPDSEPRSGYSGTQAWQAALRRQEVPEAHIVGVDTTPFDLINTYIEALAAVRYAKVERLSTLTIIAAPFHQLRAFISTVSVLRAEYPTLRVFNVVGRALPWYETVSHSQGVLQGVRETFVYTELERIEKYQAKGDLVTLENVLEYLRWRDGIG